MPHLFGRFLPGNRVLLMFTRLTETDLGSLVHVWRLFPLGQRARENIQSTPSNIYILLHRAFCYVLG